MITINSAHSNDDDEHLRELIFRTYFRGEPEQEQVLDELLRKRFALTRLRRAPHSIHGYSVGINSLSYAVTHRTAIECWITHC